VPPSRRVTPSPPALTDDDVSSLRTQVAAGQTPRVVVRAASASVPSGTRGNVVRLGDPKDSEYIVVRLGRDQVPFAPSELGIPGRKPVPAAARANVATPTPKAAARKTAASKTPAQEPPALKATKDAPTKAASRPATRKPMKRVPPLVVTMRFRDGGWTVEAQRGARRLAKATPLRPGAVSAFAEHVDDDSVRSALIETVDSCRAVVEERAAALRAELDAAETALRDYDSKPNQR
jgi:hypothetical protein